jgi:hypothetical protein
MKNSDFDIDFANGYAGEKLVTELLTCGYTVEVKRDMKWAKTGNLYIETLCWNQTEQAWLPSGISVSKSEYWAFVLDETVIMIPLSKLQDLVIAYGRYTECKMLPNPSKGFLISARELIG